MSTLGLTLEKKHIVNGVSIDPLFYKTLTKLADENAETGFAKPPKLEEVCRWYELFNHPIQRALMNDPIRFKICPSGRRSGKSEIAKRHIVMRAWAKPNSRFMIASPTIGQTVKIFWSDMKLLCLGSTCKSISETQHIITLQNNSTIELASLDNPARVEGVPWSGAVVDEVSDCSSDILQHLLPLFSTYNPNDISSERPWLWLIGVPEGAGQSFYYKLTQTTKELKDWATYHWKSEDILPSDIIESAKATLSEQQYKVEYEGQFINNSGTIYNNYSDANNLSVSLKPDETIYFASDFNYNPCSSVLFVIRGGNNPKIFCFDELVIEHANSTLVAEEFCHRYAGKHTGQIIIMADPSGNAGAKHGLLSSITAIEEVLRANNMNNFERKVATKAPAIVDRQNSVRAKIKSADGKIHLYVDKVKCPVLDDGLRNSVYKVGSSVHEDQSYHSHICTALGYAVHKLWPITSKRDDDKPIDYSPVERTDDYSLFNRKYA